MKIKMRGLNANETYCCNKKDVIALFDKTDINVEFGNFNIYSRNENKNNSGFRPVKSCKDRFTALMSLYYKFDEKLHDCAYLYFFIMEKESFDEELKSRFIKEVLPELYELYIKYRDGIDDCRGYTVLVGFDGSQFNFYEKFKRFD